LQGAQWHHPRLYRHGRYLPSIGKIQTGLVQVAISRIDVFLEGCARPANEYKRSGAGKPGPGMRRNRTTITTGVTE
jgi:hypothetical protein